MIIGIASYKGGVAKTTTGIHLAAFAQTLAPTVLFDGDSTRNAMGWAQRGPGLEFTVAPDEAAAMIAGNYTHRIVDTGQKPEEKDLLALAMYSDLLIIPTVPAALDSDSLLQTVRALRLVSNAHGGPVNFKVLLTRVAPDSARQVDELREHLGGKHVPVFATEIPRLKAFEKAAADGVLVSDVDDPRAERGWLAYEAVGREIFG